MKLSYAPFKKFYLTSYRVIGFSVLSVTLAALLFYAASMVFFMFNTTWLAPTVLSTTSDKMLQFRARQQSALQIKQQAEIVLSEAERKIELLTEHSESLQTLLNKTLVAMKIEAKADQLASNTALPIIEAKKTDIVKSDKLKTEFASSRIRIVQSLEAGLITKDDADKQLASLQSFENAVTANQASNLELQYNTEQLSRKSATLSGGSASIDAMIAIKTIVDMRYQLDQVRVEIATAKHTRAAAKDQLNLATKAIENLFESVYIEALDNLMTLAFVPYDNTDNVSVGQSIYDCKLLMIWCYQVGTVKRVYEDEQIVDFPVFNIRLSRTVRGIIVDLDLTDKNAMKSIILFANKPLLF